MSAPRTPVRGIAVVAVLAAALSFLAPLAPKAESDGQALEARKVRAIYVWKPDVLYATSERGRFIEAVAAANLTDVYLYLTTKDYTANEKHLRVFLPGLSKAGIRVWGMEGWRGYFADVEGPKELYAAADALIAFNGRNPDMTFYGFLSDMEPQDGQGIGRNLFHNGVSHSKLTPEQRADRDRLMTEWLEMHATLFGKLRAAGLKYSGAFPSWVDDYHGEPVEGLFEGARGPVMHDLMMVTTQYVVMSYTTKPEHLIDRISGELKSASAAGGSPRIVFSVETHAGAGKNISYADTPPKNNKAAVLYDLTAIDRALSRTFPNAYLGWAIHDWEGWRELSDQPPYGTPRR